MLKTIAFLLLFGSVALIAYAVLTDGRAWWAKKVRATRARLDTAGVNVSPGLFLVARVAIVILAYAFGTGVLGSVVFGVIMAGAGFFLPPALIARETRGRIVKLEGQLSDALTTMANGLRAGITIPQSMELVRDNLSEPVSVEFRLILREHRLGVPLAAALESATARYNTRFLRIVFSAMSVSIQVGGDVASVLKKIAESIREIQRLERNVKTLTASGRLQAKVIAVVPFFMAFMLWVGDPEQIEILFNTSIGNVILGLILIFDVVGFLLIWKISNVDV